MHGETLKKKTFEDVYSTSWKNIIPIP